VGRRKVEDTAPPGNYRFQRAFVKSSNAYFIHYGLKAGVRNLLAMGRQFHLGETIDLPTHQSDHGLFPTDERVRLGNRLGDPWTDGDTANLCIGQGELAVNPVQMAVMTAAVANGGKVFWPRLVQRLEPFEPTADARDTTQFPSRIRSELKVSARSLQIVREAMLADVEAADGTGRAAAVPGLQIGGKTGTAEVQHAGRNDDKVTWFTAFAPYEHPTHAVVVMVESGGSGGGTCAPAAGKIFRAILEREKAGLRGETLAAVNPG
jgi:penicillin-binding protein 2